MDNLKPESKSLPSNWGLPKPTSERSSCVEDLGADSLDNVELVITLGGIRVRIPDEDAEKITSVSKPSTTSRRTSSNSRESFPTAAHRALPARRNPWNRMSKRRVVVTGLGIVAGRDRHRPGLGQPSSPDAAARRADRASTSALPTRIAAEVKGFNSPTGCL